MTNAPFFTITDSDTRFTNSRSKRFTTIDAAKVSAYERLRDKKADAGVFILKTVMLIQPTSIENQFFYQI